MPLADYPTLNPEQGDPTQGYITPENVADAIDKASPTTWPQPRTAADRGRAGPRSRSDQQIPTRSPRSRRLGHAAGHRAAVAAAVAPLATADTQLNQATQDLGTSMNMRSRRMTAADTTQ